LFRKNRPFPPPDEPSKHHQKEHQLQLYKTEAHEATMCEAVEWDSGCVADLFEAFSGEIVFFGQAEVGDVAGETDLSSRATRRARGGRTGAKCGFLAALRYNTWRM
jgi:hypothetical protein